MCKLFVLFFVIFFQKAATFDGTYYNDDYLNPYRTDLDELIRSVDPVRVFCNGSDFQMDFRRMKSKWNGDCGPNDPRVNQSLKDNSKKVILNGCYPEKSRSMSLVPNAEIEYEVYSAYFQNSAKNNSIICWNHFWLYKRKMAPAGSPLIVFLHALPHASLLAHFLYQYSDVYIIEDHNYSFLFIEYKSGFGYSFHEPTNETDEIDPNKKATQVIKILDEFLAIFEEFQTVDVYLAGSYEAGKIAELVLVELSKYDTETTTMKNVKGAIITHGALDISLMLNYASTWSQYGIIDLHTAHIAAAQETLGIAIQKSKDYEQLEYFVSNFLQNKIPEIKYATELEQLISESIEIDVVENFQDRFKMLYHIGDKNYRKRVSFFGRSTTQTDSFNFTKILGKYKILYCNGQLDNIYTYSMTTEYLRQMRWPGNKKWYHAARKLWYDGDYLVGYWKKSGNLHQVLIRNSGYSVDLTSVEYYLKMVQKFIEDPHSNNDCS